ncbi:MAG TPA: glycosyltransferase family 2 protein [Tepidisphaeraceae bacterium]|jgi:chlorobactene glucosyltransferase
MTVTPEGYLAIAYGLLGPGAWAFFLFVAIKGRGRLALRRGTTPAIDAPPRVSVIVPCRNEAAGIESCLRSVLAQDYPDFSLIAVDDRSDDGTADVIDRLAAAEPRLTALHVRDGELPAGWLGKPNAVCRGVREADGQWLVFIDSDTTLAPSAVREAVAIGLSRGFDLVSFVPRFVGSGFWDSLLTPLCGMATGGMYSMHWANAHLRPQTAFACGQFIATRREAYEQIGGHEALRDSAGEDVEMARRMKRAGLKPRLGWGMDLVTTRMYASLGEIFRGWGRNFIAASRGKPWRVLGAIGFLLLCTLTVWPALAIGLAHDVPLNGRVWLGLGLLHVVLITLALVDGYRWGRSNAVYALLWPLGTLMLLAVFVRSLYQSGRRQVVWRGVRYDLKPASNGTTS